MVHFDWRVLLDSRDVLLKGAELTILLTIESSLAGIFVGLLLALCRLSSLKVLQVPATAVLEALRGTPLLVQLIWFFYALPMATGITLSPPLSAFLALSLYSGAFYGEIFRGGILSIEQGQSDAARSLGMTHWEEMRRVILPQAVRRMIPPLVNQTIVTLKNTSLASVVTVAELVYQAQYISSSTYRSLEAYTGIAAIYFVLIYPMTLLAQRLELRKGGGF